MQVLLQIIETSEGRKEVRIPIESSLTRSQVDAIRDALRPILTA